MKDFFHLIGKFNPLTLIGVTAMLILITLISILFILLCFFHFFPFYFASLIKFLFFPPPHCSFRGSAMLHVISDLMAFYRYQIF